MAQIFTVGKTDALLSTHPVSSHLFALVFVYSVVLCLSNVSSPVKIVVKILSDCPDTLEASQVTFSASPWWYTLFVHISKKFQEFYIYFTNKDMAINSEVHTLNSLSLPFCLYPINWLTVVLWKRSCRLQVYGKSSSHLINCFLMSVSGTNRFFSNHVPLKIFLI